MSKSKFIFAYPQIALSVTGLEWGMVELYRATGEMSKHPRLIIGEYNIKQADKLLNTEFWPGTADSDRSACKPKAKSSIEVEVVKCAPENFWALVDGDCVVIGMSIG